MRLEAFHPGFSTADTSYPELTFAPGVLGVSFTSSSGERVGCRFIGVAAFSWCEESDALLPGERWDGSCELFESPLLVAHAPGTTLNSVLGLRHLRLNFSACGRLEVLCLRIEPAA
jgi:hypothetical protein